MKDQLLEERVTSLSKQHQLESKEAKKIARKEAAEVKVVYIITPSIVQ